MAFKVYALTNNRQYPITRVDSRVRIARRAAAPEPVYL